MADSTSTAPAATADTSTTTPPPAAPPAAGEDLGDKGLAALQRERDARRAAEARVKELQPLADKARQLEEAGKTEAQKAADRAADAEARAAAAEARALRLEVATAKGLPPGMAARLVGATQAELEADADVLLAALTPPDPSGPLLRPDPTQGGAASGGTVPLNGDPLLRALTGKLGIRT